MTRELRFYKTEDGRWFVDLPEWTGDIEDLEMVAGADVLLDIIDMNWYHSSGNMLLRITDSVKETKWTRPRFKLTESFDNWADSGTFYKVSHPNISEFTIWLCDVTKFVFNGEFPPKIYFEIT